MPGGQCMKVTTTRFGELTFREEDVLDFPRGLYGFDEIGQYVLIQHRPDSPFRWLQAVGRPDLAFVVLDPRSVLPDYSFEIPPEDTAALGRDDADRYVILVIVGIPEDARQMTVNLMGPIVINARTRVGRQVVLSQDRYSPRFRLLDAVKRGLRSGTEGT
jgi:flagellar assembly factor FliW